MKIKNRHIVCRALCIAIAILMLFTVTPMTVFAEKTETKTYKTGDIIEFGSYPQSEVTDAALKSALTSKAGSTDGWTSYGYYISGEQSDFMKYTDVEYGGEKYRGVYFTLTRPQATSGQGSDKGYLGPGENGLSYWTSTVYWFKYEPLKWKVLSFDSTTGEAVVLSKDIIDSQQYYNNTNNRTIGGVTVYPNNYEYSDIRAWLNGTFYNGAFTDSEKNAIIPTTLDNSAYKEEYPQFDSNSTTDKVWLLSYSEAWNADYGLSPREEKRCAGFSTYAVCQGLAISTKWGTGRWYLRSADDSSCFVCSVSFGGWNSIESVYIMQCGVRPALKINLTSEITDSIFSGSSTDYNHKLAQFCVDFSLYGYNMSSLEGKLKSSGFDLIKKDADADRDEVNYFIASRDEAQNGKNMKIVFVGCIGSNKKQWYSNFDPEASERDKTADRSDAPYANENTDAHLGFADAQEYVYYNLRNYITKLKNAGVNSDSIKVVLTGHSRGAATANLLAARLVDEQNNDNALVHAGNIYAYTFATPRPTTDENSDNSKYGCIFNIVNPEDFVTKVMLAKWGYRRYGITYSLPSKTNDKNYKHYLSAMRVYYNDFTGSKYEPYADGEKSTYKIIKEMEKNVGISSHQLYVEKYRAIWNDEFDLRNIIVEWTPFEFFKNTILPVVAKESVDYGKIANLILGPGVFYRNILLFFASPDMDLPNDISVKSLIDSLKSSFGNKFEEAHIAETYYAYMHALTESQLTDTDGVRRKSYRGLVNCPVDIEIYEKSTGELVGRIVNNIIDENVAAQENAVVMDVDGDSKSFWLPSNGNYNVKLIGNDVGKMDYTVTSVDSDIGETERVNFFDIAIKDGLTMTSDFNTDTLLDDYSVELENGEKLKPSEKLADDETAFFDINVSVEGDGYATESLTAISGDYVALAAVANENSIFAGWYENGEKISDTNDLTFVAKENRNLIARFESKSPVHYHDWGEWVVTTPATVGSEGVKTRKCKNCEATETETIEKLPITEVTVNGNYAYIKNFEGFIVTVPGVIFDEIIAATGGSTKIYKDGKEVVFDEKTKPATGMQVVILSGDTVVLSCDIVVMGDIDCNGEISVGDARLALRAAVSLDNISGAVQAAASISHGLDEAVGVSDARLILRAAVSLDNPSDWMKNK